MDEKRIGRKQDWMKSFGPKQVGRKQVGENWAHVLMHMYHMVTGQKPPTKTPQEKSHPDKSPPDNKPPRIIEEIIAKYVVDSNLFRLGSTNPKKNFQQLLFFLLMYRGHIFIVEFPFTIRGVK